MAERDEVVDQFAKDIMANNIAGLMTVFTPVGMGKAMALQAAGDTGAATATGFEVADQGENLLHIIFKADDGKGGVFTQWVEVEGAWKVDDIGLIEG